MTPFEIELRLHYGFQNSEHPSVITGTPAAREAIDKLIAHPFGAYCLLQLDRTPDSNRTYCLTDRGIAYTAALLAVPLPTLEARWRCELPVHYTPAGMDKAPSELT